MSIFVRCACGASYDLPYEYGGTQVSCTGCGKVIDVPGNPIGGGDPLFSLPRVCIKQKKLAINEHYYIRNEQEQLLAVAVRPIHFLKTMLALLLGFLALAGSCTIGALLATFIDNYSETISVFAMIFFAVIAVFAGVIVMIVVRPKRHVTFYRDEAKTHPFMEVLQDKKFQPIITTYTVRTTDGTVIGLLRKNNLFDILRKRWLILTPEEQLISMAKEDSIALSILRRLIGPMFGILRLNFVFLKGDSDQIIGEFNRNFTLFDSYLLDMSADPEGIIDRRLSLATGVMLDTGEKR